MPYIILVIGLLIGGFALYRLFLNANVQQIKDLFLVAVITAICIALFYLAVTGRLPAALALIVALYPPTVALWKMKKENKTGENNPTSEPMTCAEALDILGLKEGASTEDIQAAYKKLMQKIHPDNEGSDWMAAKLNNARDLLLDKEN